MKTRWHVSASNRRTAGGFTLLEILVASVAFAMIVMVIKITLLESLELRERAQARPGDLRPDPALRRHGRLSFGRERLRKDHPRDGRGPEILRPAAHRARALHRLAGRPRPVGRIRRGGCGPLRRRAASRILSPGEQAPLPTTVKRVRPRLSRLDAATEGLEPPSLSSPAPRSGRSA